MAFDGGETVEVDGKGFTLAFEHALTVLVGLADVCKPGAEAGAAGGIRPHDLTRIKQFGGVVFHAGGDRDGLDAVKNRRDDGGVHWMASFQDVEP